MYLKQNNQFSPQMHQAALHTLLVSLLLCVLDARPYWNSCEVTVVLINCAILICMVSVDCGNTGCWDQALGFRERWEFACFALNYEICMFWIYIPFIWHQLMPSGILGCLLFVLYMRVCVCTLFLALQYVWFLYYIYMYVYIFHYLIIYVFIIYIPSCSFMPLIWHQLIT